MAPIQGKILGVARIISNNPYQDFAEFSKIEEFAGTLKLTPFPNGEQGVSFVATSIELGKVVFENPNNKFPSRIVYQIQANGSLLTQISGEQNGKPVSMEYVEERIN
jgi:hypothetical protein